MKQIIFSALLIIFCASLFAQSIITKSGLRVKADYSNAMTDRLKYPSKLDNNRDYILYSEIDTITGYINPSLQKDILKSNNSVVFVKDTSLIINENYLNRISQITLKEGRIFECVIQLYDNDSVVYSNLSGQKWNTIAKNSIGSIKLLPGAPQGETFLTNVKDYSFNSNSAGDYLAQAGNNYLLGVGLGIGGGVVTFIGTSSTNSEALVFVGAGMALSGFVFTILGHTKLIKAGKMLNTNKAISFHPASSGIGLALNF